MSADPKAPEPGRAPSIYDPRDVYEQGATEAFAALVRYINEYNLNTVAWDPQVSVLRPFLAAHRRAREIGDAVNAEPPATPEPAAPKPRVSDERLLEISEEDAHAEWCGSPMPLVLDLQDARAKVAELEARIAAYQEREAACCPEDVGFDEYIGALKDRIRGYEMLQEGLRAGIDAADRRRDEARAALARANEALRSIAALEATESSGIFVLGQALGIANDELAAGAQGSAAQKPEGP